MDERYEFRVQGRYEYWAIDLYRNRSLVRCIERFKTRKQANLIATELNNAYQQGLADKQTELDNLNGVY